MPRSFSNWNERRRPDLSLFTVPANPDQDGDISGIPISNASQGPVDELEALIAGLLEDGSPIMSPGSNLNSPKSSPIGPRPDQVQASCQALALPVGQPLGTATTAVTTTATAYSTDQDTCNSHHVHGTVHVQAQAELPKPQRGPATTLPAAEFLWAPAETCLVTADLHGNAINRAAMPAHGVLPLRVHIELHPPLLYWADRRQWMWHKKWALPTVTVRIERTAIVTANGGTAAPVIPPNAVERMYVNVTAGTMHDDATVLENQGLGGDCQRLLQLGPNGAAEASFTRLVFTQTSFNCGNRPFHIVVTLLAAPPRTDNGADGMLAAFPPPPGAPPPLVTTPLIPLACVCSSPVRVDARKRSKGERPEAAADDVRLVSRQRPAGGAGNATAAPAAAPASVAHNQGGAHPLSQSHSAQGGGQAGIPRSLTDGDGGSDLRFSARTLMDATSDAVVELRPDGVVVQMLSSTAFGYTPAQILGRSFLSICHTDEHPAILQTMQALLMMNLRQVGRGVVDSAGPAPSTIAIPKTVRMLHRVIVGLNGDRTAETVAVDTILSVTAATLAGSSPETLLLCARRALPVGVDPSSPSFSFRIFPWAAYDSAS